MLIQGNSHNYEQQEASSLDHINQFIRDQVKVGSISSRELTRKTYQQISSKIFFMV